MSTPFVAILMGSDSSLLTMQATQEVLAKLDVLTTDKASQDKLRRG